MRAGERATLSCTTSNSNPQAVITWYARGKQVLSNDDDTTVRILSPAVSSLRLFDTHGPKFNLNYRSLTRLMEVK